MQKIFKYFNNNTNQIVQTYSRAAFIYCNPNFIFLFQTRKIKEFVTRVPDVFISSSYLTLKLFVMIRCFVVSYSRSIYTCIKLVELHTCLMTFILFLSYKYLATIINVTFFPCDGIFHLINHFRIEVVFCGRNEKF